MTEEQIEEAAIEAAESVLHFAMTKGYGLKNSFRAAIKAYNAAMWRPASEHPANGITMLVSDGVDVWDLHGDRVGPKGVDQLPTHFRPIPKPPEKP